MTPNQRISLLVRLTHLADDDDSRSAWPLTVLCWLWVIERPASQSEIARGLLIDRATVAVSLSRLQALELAERVHTRAWQCARVLVGQLLLLPLNAENISIQSVSSGSRLLEDGSTTTTIPTVNAEPSRIQLLAGMGLGYLEQEFARFDVSKPEHCAAEAIQAEVDAWVDEFGTEASQHVGLLVFRLRQLMKGGSRPRVMAESVRGKDYYKRGFEIGSARQERR